MSVQKEYDSLEELRAFPSPFLRFFFGDLQKEIRQTQKERRGPCFSRLELDQSGVIAFAESAI